MSASDTSTWETDEEFLARLEEIRARAEEEAKPKFVASVSPKMAEAIKANPGSLCLNAKDAGGDVIDRPRRTEIIEVMDEPTVDGKLRRAWRTDCATGERSVIEFVDGYRQPPGAAHVYDPLAALKENGE